MFWLIEAVSCIKHIQSPLEVSNMEIFPYLKEVAESDHFSKIQMSFNDKCPLDAKKCGLTSCSAPRIKFQGEDGYIDLLAVKESFSTVSSNGSSATIWKNLYSLVEDHEPMKRLLSGLHYSVTTHLSYNHTKIFNFYFSNPLLFKKRYNKEYKDNFYYLYTIIRSAVATLFINEGEITEPTRIFSKRIRRLISKERRLNNSDVVYQNVDINMKSLIDTKHTKDIEYSSKDLPREYSSTDEFIDGLPKIDKSFIDVTNQMVKYVSCLECEKCKLWGTIQVKGIKSAIKALNGMPLFKNEAIFLVNLFRQLSITMIEGERMLNTRFPHPCILITCHKQILFIIVTVLSITLGYLRIQRRKKVKTE